ncbi:unnamed protein product [Mortierella alpina]
MRSSLILSLGALLATSLLMQTDAQQQLCNGYAQLCAKTYDKVAYATAHNAYAYTPPGGLGTNQNNDIPTQLKDGIRAFMLDAYNPPSGDTSDIQLCHSTCSLVDAGPLSKTLGQLKAFMDANPNEVITILWENAANLSPARYQAVYTAAGLVPYSYTPTSNGAWPTLAEMISSKKRLVSFLDNGADASVPWLMAEYDFVFETPWSIPKDTPYPCTVDRPKDQRKPMYVLNHFISGQIQSGGTTIDVPQSGAAEKTNGPDLLTHINTCLSTFNQSPNFIAVDFYEKGSVLQTVAQVNGVQWNGKLPTQPKAGSGSGSGSGTGTGNAASQQMDKRALGAISAVVVGSIGLLTL